MRQTMLSYQDAEERQIPLGINACFTVSMDTKP